MSTHTSECLVDSLSLHHCSSPSASSSTPSPMHHLNAVCTHPHSVQALHDGEDEIFLLFSEFFSSCGCVCVDVTRGRRDFIVGVSVAFRENVKGFMYSTF